MWGRIIESRKVNPDESKKEVKSWNVTQFSPVGWLCCCPTTLEYLTIGDDEMELKTVQHDCCGGSSVQILKRPYAHLGKVNVNMQYCYKWSVETDYDIFSPGFGYDKQLAVDIAQALQERKISRGNIKLLRLHESVGVDLEAITSLTDSILRHRNITTEDAVEPHIPIQFGRKVYDVTSLRDPCGGAFAEKYCRTILMLEEEELIKTDIDCCSESSSRRSYAQLGSVSMLDKTPGYICCPHRSYCGIFGEYIGGHSVGIDAWILTPRFGYEIPLVEEVYDELQRRKVEKGNIAQLNVAERSSKATKNLLEKIKLIADQLEVKLGNPLPGNNGTDTVAPESESIDRGCRV